MTTHVDLDGKLEDVDWPICGASLEDGSGLCIGVASPELGDCCWGHASERDIRNALENLRTTGDIDARGVHITPEVFRQLVAASPREDGDAPVFGKVLFERAVFDVDVAEFASARFRGTADFRRAEFLGTADFRNTVFEGVAEFAVASFCGRLWFHQAMFRRKLTIYGAVFHGPVFFHAASFEDELEGRGASFRFNAWLAKANFADDAGFGGAEFHRGAEFDHVTFQRGANFTGVSFGGLTTFRETAFRGTAWFHDAAFRDYAWFHETEFDGDADFRGSTFRLEAGFEQAIFQRVRRFGPIMAKRGINLDDAVFHQKVVIEISASGVCCRDTRFLAGVQLRARWAEIVLDDADLSAPSIVSGSSRFDGIAEARWAQAMKRLRRHKPWDATPRLISLRRADVAGLTVARIDLRGCRFADTHHLDQIKMGPATVFAAAPTGWRWTTRRTLAEEHVWRARRFGGGWHGSAERPPSWHKDEPTTVGQIAALYRALRKAREDGKDEPGSADFYYGEMEMRRHDTDAPPAERYVLFLYWILSGYGLRASRAVGWLLAVTTAASLSIAQIGLDGTVMNRSFPSRLGAAALVAVEGALFRTAGQPLTYSGHLIQIALRVVGPILLGLTALSIRGRVKR